MNTQANASIQSMLLSLNHELNAVKIHLFEDGRIVILHSNYLHLSKPYGITVVDCNTRYRTPVENRFYTMDGVLFFAASMFGPMDWNVL